MTPPKNKAPRDAPEMTAYMTMGMLGGITGPTIAEVIVKAAEYLFLL